MKRKNNMMDAMDDDCRVLTLEVPAGVLQKSSTSHSTGGWSAAGGARLRAFTVHPGWAWAIMQGVKKQEWRTFLPNPREGGCAIHVSRLYSRAQWKAEAQNIRNQWHVELIPYEELVAEWCGKVVGFCNYAADEQDWDVDAYGWRLTKVRPLKHRIACKGALKLWKMDPKLSKEVIREL